MADRPHALLVAVLVEIWSDVVCPWCYIGKRRFEGALARFEHADEVEVRWRSFELDPRAPRRRSGEMADHLARKYGTTLEEARQRLKGLDRLAAADGLRYDLARTQGGNTYDAHRLIHLGASKDAATAGTVKEALLAAYFTDLEPIGEPEVLRRVGVAAGLDEAEVVDVLGSERFGEEVRIDEIEAARLGCTGVPFFVFDRAFAVPGAQDSETLLAVLERAWRRAADTDGDTAPDAAAGCADEACAV